MSVTPNPSEQEDVVKTAEDRQKDKEYNFSHLKKQLESERQSRLEMERELQELRSKSKAAPVVDDDDNYDEPYIDKRFLQRKLDKEREKIVKDVEKRTEERLYQKMQEEKRNSWLKANPDFQEVMQHAQKFAEQDPELAETILEMPEGFERQKLVYKNIKALGLHKPQEAKDSVQDKIDRNQRGPFYQPSNMGAAPYGNRGDFSSSGKKNAYDQMKALQARLGISS